MKLLSEKSHDDRARYHQRYRTKRGLYNPHVHNLCLIHDLPERERICGDGQGRYPAGYRGRAFSLSPLQYVGYSTSKHQGSPGCKQLGDSPERSSQHVWTQHPKGCDGPLRSAFGLRVYEDGDQGPGWFRSRGHRKLASHDICPCRCTVSDVSRTRRNVCDWRNLSLLTSRRYETPATVGPQVIERAHTRVARIPGQRARTTRSGELRFCPHGRSVTGIPSRSVARGAA